MEDTVLQNWDFVVDAIDTLAPKINLMKLCYENKIPFVSSMGSGGKMDPMSICISDISKSYNCTLARITRKYLHRLGIYKGIEVVYSSEKTDKCAVVEEETENKKSIVGTISYMPVIFGCMCASVAIRRILRIQ